MRPIHAVIAVLVLAVAGAAWYFWQRSQVPPPPPPPPPAARVAPLDQATPPSGPLHPVPAEAVAPDLPPLVQSDAALTAALAEAIGMQTLARFFTVEDLARRFVATVDNLPREAVSPRLNPAKPVPGAFRAAGKEGSRTIDPKNAERYKPLVEMVAAADTRKLVDVYLRFYPLFQQAYVELGYPQGYFNDRLIAAIDDMLLAPEPAGPVALAQPHVLYEYADADLEKRSAGQKALLRAGTDNARRLKAKLRDLRAELVARKAAR